MHNALCEPELEDQQFDSFPSVPEPPAARILVVDDDVNMREFCAQALSLYGYSANTAADGALALAELHRSHYDLVLTDLNMPQMTGTELIQQMRAEGNSIPVILTSGNSMSDIPTDDGSLGLATLLAKPFLLDQLATLVKHLLKASSAVAV